MPSTQLATKASPPAGPPDAAQLDQEAADAAVARLTKAITELRQTGPGSDPALLGCLQAELEGAQKVLRRVDLEAAEQTAAATGPLPPKTLEKIRRRRRKVEDLHAAVLGRMGEHRRLREHLHGLKNEIAELKASWEFKQDNREFLSPFVRPPRDPQLAEERRGPSRNSEKTPQSIEKLALMERDLESTGAELTIAAAVQAEASARWETEKRTLGGWESAARSLGPAARAVLDALPRVGTQSLGEVTRQDDFRDGVPGYTQPMIRGR